MILRTDTIGHFENPTEINIKSAISYAGENAIENDLVKLMTDDENYLCIWIGKKETGHILELKCRSKKIACKERLNSEKATQVMIKYFHGDISWLDEFLWEKPIVQKFLESIQILTKLKNSSPEQKL